jgi:uncharacterized membrane protein
MGKSRLEAFSDGVIAIIITIMVLELKVPHDPTPAALVALSPVFLSYVLSFIYVAIYWSNHHHFFHAVKHVTAGIMWSNMHLLFWLSLMPFTTGWMGENHFATWPVVIYAVNLLLTAIAYTIMAKVVVANHGADSEMARALGSDKKGKISLLCYALSIPLAFYNPWLSGLLFAAVAALWVIPDRRIERVLAGK